MKLTTASAVAALHILFTPVAWAQTTPPGEDSTEQSQPAADAPTGNDVIVTGTRERGRTQFDTLAPVDVLPETLIRSSVSSDRTTRWRNCSLRSTSSACPPPMARPLSAPPPCAGCRPIRRSC